LYIYFTYILIEKQALRVI